ncbi:hypothetical protein, conserved [Eimeria acervulina]|uniref:Transmembrane protein n=1 Tax=Eimeria acervulina TaxID=5801 RepID=U6GUT4_EIMAC|nr:hypothetical protein, conserved [Eimeria acervulina]CDI83332.1 hypothetical protein, conserved [Eimeria acervulina]
MRLCSIGCPLLLGVIYLTGARAASVQEAAGAAAASQLQQQASVSASVEANASAQVQADNGAGSGAEPTQRPIKRLRGEDEQNDGPSAETRKNYDEVLGELQKDPRYQRARERNDALAEQRRQRVNAWMKGRSQQGQAPSAEAQADKERRAKYDKVVEELQQDPRFQRARERLGGASDEGSKASNKDTKPHTFSR